MQINLKELSTQTVETTTGTKKMRLSENAQSMVFQLFTKNVYSNPIGTIVREITSNCFDSHIEANVKAPVLIKKTVDKQTNTTYISFIDYGVGMSPDRIDNIYGVYFESTKRLDNSQIGGWGIGGKTPLAYKRSTGHGEGEYDNSFFVITVFNHIKYYYCIYEGADTPVISLLHSEPTEERNGTEIRIPVLERDLDTFAKEMVRQLYYFENIIFEGFEGNRYKDTLTNDYQIVQGKSFLYRGTDYDANVHVCLGRVAYPIDYNVLGVGQYEYRMPFALKIDVGEIGVTVSRESLDYSESTIKILKKKLIELKAEITAMLSKQYDNIVTLEDYFNVKINFGTLNFGNGKSVYVGNLINKSSVDYSNFKFSFMKMPTDSQLFRLFFKTNHYGKKPAGRRYSSNHLYEFDGNYEQLISRKNLLYVNDTINRKIIKQAYLKSEHSMFHIISKRSLTDREIKPEISEIFNVHLDNLIDANGKPISYIQTLIDMQEEYFTIVRKYAKDYDKVEVPDDFVIDRKKKDSITDEMRKTTIPIGILASYRTKERISLDKLFDYKMPIFYGTEEDYQKLRNAQAIFDVLFDINIVVNGTDYNGKLETRGCGRYGYGHGNSKKPTKGSILFIQLAKNNVKYMQYCKKAYHIDEFFWRMLHRKTDIILNYFQLYGCIEKYNNLHNLYKCEKFNLVNPTWGQKINTVNNYFNSLNKNVVEGIQNIKSNLEMFFDFTKLPMTKEQETILKIINEIDQLEKKNKDILYYIDTRRGEFLTNPILVDILKKVMVF